MNLIQDVFPNPDVQVFARGDNINGGLSKSTLLENNQGAQLHCETRTSTTWPFCNLEVNLSKGSNKGIDLAQFDHLLLWLDHQSSVQDTMLVYLVNAEVGTNHLNEKNSQIGGRYIDKSNMTTILPTVKNSFYSLPLDNFIVPSWWVLHHNAQGNAAQVRLDNVIKLSLSTGDSDKLRSVDILLKKAQLTGKWIRANTLYLFLFITWIGVICIHVIYRVYQLAEQLKLNHIKHKKLQEINKFLSIQKNEFEALSKTDPLTGIHNRAGTRELLQTMQNKPDTEYSLIMFDIDHFKQVNDSYGHEIGDKILLSLAKKVKSHLRGTDHLARWGGEEFIIICPNTNQQAAFFVADLIRQTIAKTRLAEQLSITCSFGVAQFEYGKEEGIKSMFEAADAAMYAAKKGGRNRVEM
jgi:diguanylate cyclase (GGDEF)-like protein